MSQCVAAPAVCSGNGVCNGTTCVCNSNLFTGKSDWVSAEGRDCQIVLPVIWAFWSLNLLEILVVVAVAAPALVRLFKHHARVRSIQKQKGKAYSIRANLGLLSILPFWLVTLPSHSALAVYKLVSRNSQLGIDLALTILWQVSRISFDLSMSTARAALANSTQQSEGASEGAIIKRAVLIWTMFGVSAASTFMIWPVYATSGTNFPLAEGLFAAHFILSGFVQAFNAFESHRLAKSIYTSLTESHEKLKDPRILSVRDELVTGQNFERASAIFMGICYIVLGAVPRLWTTYDYFWCTLWLISPIMGLKGVQRLESAQKSARGDKERDKLIAALQTEDGGGRPVALSTSDVRQAFASRWGWAFRSSAPNRISGGST